jgi:hypothetical protein
MNVPSKQIKDVGSLPFGFMKDMKPVSCFPRKGKSVIQVSSVHHKRSINEDTEQEVIDYNNEKCANY